MSCWYGEFNPNFDAVEKHWNSKKNIVKFIGKIGGHSSDNFKGETYLNDVAEHLFEKPWLSSFEFTDGQYRRIIREIDKIDNNYQNKRISTFMEYYYVPAALADYSPVTRKFYEGVNLAINYERNNLNTYLTYTSSIKKSILNSLINNTSLSKSQAKKMQADMADLETKMLTAGSNDDFTNYSSQYDELFNTSGGQVISQYIDLMQMPKSEFNKLYNDGKLYKDYDKDLLVAVDDSRKLLDSMGKVGINGFRRMSSVVKNLASRKILSNIDQNYVKKIDSAIDRIQEGMEQGGYLPHILLDKVVEINAKASKILSAGTNLPEANRSAGELLDQINDLSAIPNLTRSRNEALNNIWSKNPFYILDQYSKDIIAFNKIQAIQDFYLPAVRRFYNDNHVNKGFIQSMRNFIEDTYTISTKGLLERPDYINGTIRTLNAIETVKSMGLGVTGAIRNGASAAFFFAKNGVGSARAAISKYNSHYRGELSKIEQEQGFEFGEAGRELVAEGLIPSTVNKSDIVFDPLKQVVTYRDKGILKKLDPAIDTVVGGSLIFHRFTENMSRKWMFRTAWIESYEMLKGHNVLKPHKNYSNFKKANDKEISNMATRFALKAVNNFAFEYAPHAKARMVGGTAPRGELNPKTGLPIMKTRDYVTGMGEVIHQFLHFPMSFLHLQSKILTNTYDAALSKQWDAPEMQTALRFAGLYLTVEALSTVLNLNFANTLENDTVEKVKDLHDYMFLPEEDLEHKRGILNDFASGPWAGNLLYAANIAQLYDMPDDRWGQMILGYIDYYERGDLPPGMTKEKGKVLDSEERSNSWQRLFGTTIGKSYTKLYPAYRDGRGMDFFRHLIGWYPTTELKERREHWNNYSKKFTGSYMFTKKRKKKGPPTFNEKLDKLLKQLKNA